MMSLRTADTWAGAAVTVTRSSGGASTVTLTTQRTAYDAMQTIVAALAIGLGGTWSWSWARDPATGGALLSLAVTGVAWTWSATVDATAQARLGWAAAVPALSTSYTGPSPASGTWAPLSTLSISRYIRDMTGDGDGGGAGAVRRGVPGLSGRRPSVEAAGDMYDAARLTAVLIAASSPRRGWLYQAGMDAWRDLSVGEAARSGSGPSDWYWSLTCTGEPL